MTKIQHKGTIFIGLFIIMFSLLSMFSNLRSVYASEGHTLTIEQHGNNIWNEENDVEGNQFRLWFLGKKSLNGDQKEAIVEMELEKINENFGEPVASSEIDSYGQAKIKNLNSGSYVGIEVDKNNQKVLTTMPFIVYFSSNSTDKTVYIKQEIPRSNLNIYKVGVRDKREIPLKDVSFNLYRQGDQQPIRIKDNQVTTDQTSISELVTDEDGYIRLSGLLPGNYQLIEKETNPGYEVIEQPIQITVKKNSNQEIKVQNYYKEFGGYRFRKVNREDQSLEGAQFDLFVQDEQGEFKPVHKDGSQYRLFSNEDGYFEVINLPYGAYQLREIVAPKGYQLLDEPIEFAITDQSYLNNTIMKIYNDRLVESGKPDKPNPGKGKGESQSSGLLPNAGYNHELSIILVAIIFILLGLIIRRRNESDVDK